MTTLMLPDRSATESVVHRPRHLKIPRRSSPRRSRVPAPDFSAIDDPKIRDAAEKEFGKVRDTFTRENLIAGAEIMDALASTLHWEDKTIVFDRSGVTAWLGAILDPAMTCTSRARPKGRRDVASAPDNSRRDRRDEKSGGHARDAPPAPAPANPVYASPQSLPSDNLRRGTGNGE